MDPQSAQSVDSTVAEFRATCLQFFKGYDRLLTRYMRPGEGIGQDLTVVSDSCYADKTTLLPQNTAYAGGMQNRQNSPVTHGLSHCNSGTPTLTGQHLVEPEHMQLFFWFFAWKASQSAVILCKRLTIMCLIRPLTGIYTAQAIMTSLTTVSCHDL